MSFVDTAEFAELDFPVGRCDRCGREVLAYLSYASEGGAALCCVHCDAPLPLAPRPASGSALPEIGYGLLELQGCGNPDCGGGQCGRAMMKEAAADQDTGTPESAD